MTEGLTRRIFVEMFREEWRLHAHLFRGTHFAFFPVLIALLTAGMATLLVVTGTTSVVVFAGLHGLVFIFGLHTGSIGFIGRDALRALLGDLTLLVFSARTLPISQRRLFGVFVLKDVVYYAFLFLLPLSLGTVPILHGGTGAIAVARTMLHLWGTLSLTFALGLGVTIAGLGMSRWGVRGLGVLIATGGVIGVGWSNGVELVAFTPYGLFLEPTIGRLGSTTTAIVAVWVVGAVTFDVTSRRPARMIRPAFRPWWRRLGNPIAAKTMLDVHRSSGGFVKVGFSAAVLFVVSAGLIDIAGRITGVAPSVGISFGTILGLTGFTTYNWLTQGDDIDAYFVHPIEVAEIFAAKFRAFLLIGPLVALGFFVLAITWRWGSPLEAVVGGVVLVGVACYIFGTTVFLTGVSPNEFLFDSVLFAAFGIAMVVPLVPILVVGFVFTPVSVGLAILLGASGVVLAIAGIVLYRWSIPRWSRRYRER